MCQPPAETQTHDSLSETSHQSESPEPATTKPDHHNMVETTTTTTTFDEESKNCGKMRNVRRKSAEQNHAENAPNGRKSAELYNGVALGSPSVSGSGQVDQEDERRSEDDRRSDLEAKRHLFTDAETNTVSSSGKINRVKTID